MNAQMRTKIDLNKSVLDLNANLDRCEPGLISLSVNDICVILSILFRKLKVTVLPPRN